MEALRLDRIYKNFSGLQVLRDLSLSVEAGDCVAVVGPNGAGKTTLFNIITGELSASAGHIYVFGQEITTMPTHRRVHLGLGRSFQITHLFPFLTIMDNVVLALHGVKPSRYQMFRPYTAYDELMVKTQKMLESIDLWEKRDAPIQALSYGQQRQLEILLSLASEPKLLLLDEPTSGLSLAEVPPFISTIKTLASGTTVLLASHDMDVVFGLANRVVVLYFGRVMADGTPEKIQADPEVRELYLGIKEDRANAEVS